MSLILPDRILWWTRAEFMKEVLTKSFWKDVKKTFDEALEGPPPAESVVQTPAEDVKAPVAPEPPSPAD